MYIRIYNIIYVIMLHACYYIVMGWVCLCVYYAGLFRVSIVQI